MGEYDVVSAPGIEARVYKAGDPAAQAILTTDGVSAVAHR